MQQCACVDFNNRCDEHKDLVIGPNLITGMYEPMDMIPLDDFRELMNESGNIPETDAMGREKFWEDIGRQDD